MDWVIDRSRTREVAVLLVVVYDPMPSETVLAGAAFRAVYEAVLLSAAARFAREAPSVEVEAAMLTGHPRTQLLAAATDCDLVVTGSNRRGGADDGGHGNLPIRISAAAPCPTVVVPVGWAPSDGPIMLGLDATNQQPALVDFATREARLSGRELTVVHSWHVPTILAVTLFAHPAVWESIGEAHRDALARTIARIREESGIAAHEWLREGVAARVLTGEAAVASLLVVGRHARASVGETLMGSTSHELLLTMPCPVAVVPE